MPTHDEGDRLGEVLRDLDGAKGACDVTVFVVDDGSDKPVRAETVVENAGEVRVFLARHAINLGQGAALETARRLALAHHARAPFDAFVTMDADGQHCARDAFALAMAVLPPRGADVALGNRFTGHSAVPRARHVVLAGARFFERLTTGLRLGDAHNGLRAFRPSALVSMRLRQNRMAHATELTRLLSRRSLHIVEVPVSIRYTEATLAKGQRATSAFGILADLFRGFLFGE